ncbi:MAG: YdiY family protein [Aestuariibacter sp.]
MKKLILISGLLLTCHAVAEEAPQKDFTMDGELGLIFTTGNTETTSVKGRISANQELEMWSNDYLLEALYQQDEVGSDESGAATTETTAQKWFASAQGNYKLTNPKNRLFAFASYEDDRFSNFDYQATLAGGWNSQWWKTDRSRLNYSIGPGYAFAKEQDGTDVSGIILRAAVDYQWKVSPTSTFKQIISTEVGADNTKSKSETSITAKINGSLSMKASLLLNHNSDVSDDTENLDTETAVTLVYTFF